ncbi:hypothetical protein Tter_1782 [Thermobaculum terrenum ATCC BAA-798]|uniref:Uncharacterized protein n=1 Tax=Thermobaculum terrenum (strain ATCC BAA-798 / CCMEE 7001 / YNP1) TaxID=525904 RepID=D1CD23_THET1|nr:hypothetical protein Tter_1782 [Thermobaculum terrenum ATCC BAA-798]
MPTPLSARERGTPHRPPAHPERAKPEHIPCPQPQPVRSSTRIYRIPHTPAPIAQPQALGSSPSPHPPPAAHGDHPPQEHPSPWQPRASTWDTYLGYILTPPYPIHLSRHRHHHAPSPYVPRTHRYRQSALVHLTQDIWQLMHLAPAGAGTMQPVVIASGTLYAPQPPTRPPLPANQRHWPLGAPPTLRTYAATLPASCITPTTSQATGAATLPICRSHLPPPRPHVQASYLL